MFILSNYRSDLDHVEFESYKGERRSLHLNKQCWSAKINKDLFEFTRECQHEVMLHVSKQFSKAKELNLDHQFRFQIKYGDFYLTNIPAMFLEEAISIPLWQLRSALSKGYRSHVVNLDPKIEEISSLTNENDNRSEITQKKN